MGYIEDLRKVVGNRPVIMVGAAMLLVDEHRRLLMGLRSDNRHWGIPGGSMEPGETLETTARREVLEETGLTIGEMSLFGVFSGQDLFYTYPNGDQVYNVTVVYICKDFSGLVSENDEHTKFHFFSVSDLPENISPPIRPIIQQWASAYSAG